MADERTSDERIAPVALPAGQFELSELEKSLGKAVNVQDREKHPERINKAIAESIKNPEVLANLDRPAIPAGARLAKQGVVYAEGAEPVEREAVVFDGVEAEDGTAASELRYQNVGEKVIATDEPAGAPADLVESAPATVSGLAAERVETSPPPQTETIAKDS